MREAPGRHANGVAPPALLFDHPRGECQIEYVALSGIRLGPFTVKVRFKTPIQVWARCCISKTRSNAGANPFSPLREAVGERLHEAHQRIFFLV
jgi:hypothetical protein